MAIWGTGSINRDPNSSTEWRSVYVQGSNPVVSSTFESLWETGGLYQGFQAPAPGPLRVAAGGNTADNQSGSGAHSVRLTGLLDDGQEADEDILTHATDGTLAGDFGAVNYARLNGAFAPSTGGHFFANVGLVQIGNSTGQIFGAMPAGGSTSQVAWFTIPKGYEGVVVHVSLTTDGKAVDGVLCHKNNDASTFSASAAIGSGPRTMDNWDGVTNVERDYPAGLGERNGTNLKPLTDVFFSVLATGPDARVTGAFGMFLHQLPATT